MINEVQTRNYIRYQKLHVYLTANTSVYSSYIPFNREAQSFTANFNLLESFLPQKDLNGINFTISQKELKNKIALQVAAICNMAIAYAEQYNDDKLAAAISFSKNDVLRFKDAEVFGLVTSIINICQSMLTDVHFMEYDITGEMLENVMRDAITFADNLEAAGKLDRSIAVDSQKVSEIAQLLDKNAKQLDRLVNKFISTHPAFVAGYYINSILEKPILSLTGIEGAITCEADNTSVPGTLASVVSKRKEAFASNIGNFAILKIYGCECEMTVAASGFASKTIMMDVPQGNTAEVDIAL